jgi:anti-anti-sigma factor
MEISSSASLTIVHLGASYSAFAEPEIHEAEETINEAMDASPSPHLVLDFSRTEYFGSVFFEVLFRLWKRTEARGGRFVLCHLSPDCMEILDTARLTTLWEIVPDRQAAQKLIDDQARSIELDSAT